MRVDDTRAIASRKAAAKHNLGAKGDFVISFGEPSRVSGRVFSCANKIFPEKSLGRTADLGRCLGRLTTMMVSVVQWNQLAMRLAGDIAEKNHALLPF